MARLRVARLRVARLRVARLRVARLTMARLRVARLTMAWLRVARLRVARLTMAWLRVARVVPVVQAGEETGHGGELRDGLRRVHQVCFAGCQRCKVGTPPHHAVLAAAAVRARVMVRRGVRDGAVWCA